MPKKTIDNVDVASKRVLMRADFNVPLDEDGAIKDDRRIRLALPSITSVIDRGGRLIIMSHLGRPTETGLQPELSMRPVAARIGELLPDVTVLFPGDLCTGDATAAAVNAMQDGEILVLENLRFNREEIHGGDEFSATLAGYGDIYSNDAFGTAHRDHSSMVGVPQAMGECPRVSGLLMFKELVFLSTAIETAEHPFVMIMGGSKMDDKIGIMEHLLGRVDTILVGGALAYTFLKALGHTTGGSLVSSAMVKEAQRIIDAAAASPTDLILSCDHVCGKAATRITPVEVHDESIPEGWIGLDIGPKTSGEFTAVIRKAKTILWDGPMGAFEVRPFDVGTREIAKAVGRASAGGATSIVGGGDMAAALAEFGVAEQFTHISTGGGASVALLAGARFPSVDLLEDLEGATVA